MFRRNGGLFVAVLAVVLMMFGGALYAAEHPGTATAEHPKAKMMSELTKADLASAIKGFVEKDAKRRGGYFLVYDDAEKKPVALTLVKVHEDRLSKVSENLYFVCADFKATDGAMYDVDIFMMGPDKDNLKATEITIHKVAGKERYTWGEEGGVWKRKPVAMPGKSVERPTGHEHPQGSEHK
jgi:hypothetical protein